MRYLNERYNKCAKIPTLSLEVLDNLNLIETYFELGSLKTNLISSFMKANFLYFATIISKCLQIV